jgi:hypothetical protein
MMTIMDNIEQMIDHLNHEQQLDKVVRMINLRKLKIQGERNEKV